jgi:WD40 repeat protein
MSRLTQLHEVDLQSGHITKPRWSPNGRYLAVPTESGKIAIFDLKTGQVNETSGRHSAEVTAVCWDPKEERMMSAALDGQVGVWELETRTGALFPVQGHKHPLHSIEWTDEGAFAMTCSADRLRALDGACLATGWTEDMENVANTYTESTAAYCSHQTTLLLAMAAEKGGLLVLVSLLSGDVLSRMPMERPVKALAWSPVDGLLAVGAGDKLNVFATTQEGLAAESRELSTHVPQIHAVSFSGDGTLVGAMDAEGLKIWDLENGQNIISRTEDMSSLSTRAHAPGIAFHPTKPLLASVAPSGTTLRILELSGV